MGLHTEYLGHLHIAPVLNADEIEFLQAFSGTRHCGDRTPLDVAEHPLDNESRGDVDADSRVSDGRPGLWCPWTCCQDGCCLIWDQV